MTIQTTVHGVTEAGATIDYEITEVAPSHPPMVTNDGRKIGPAGFPNLTSKVGPEGLPLVGFSGGGPYLLLGEAGITPSATTGVGQTVTVHWRSDANETVEATGKITGLDKNAKTLTADWNVSETLKNGPPILLKFTSVYSTVDFSLVSSKGAADIGGPFSIKRL